MLTFTDAERAYLSEEIRTDEQGRQNLVGLTHEETAEFWAMVRMLAVGSQLSASEAHRYRVLRDKLGTALDAH